MSTADSRRKALRIADLASAVFDTGRRGAPKPGCDCVQCFGYCITDADKVMRDAHVNKSQSRLFNPLLLFKE